MLSTGLIAGPVVSNLTLAGKASASYLPL